MTSARRRPATPEYILDAIRDSHRQQCQFDPEAEPDAELTFETTVADWRSVRPARLRPLGRALDSEWSLGRPDAARRSVLEPAKERTLRDVCDFVASSHETSIEPMSILGVMLPRRRIPRDPFAVGEAGADGLVKRRRRPSTHTCRYLGVPSADLTPGTERTPGCSREHAVV
ncbi:MAG: hypothetical protein WKF75_16825 [Singulisphaera sp.]